MDEYRPFIWLGIAVIWLLTRLVRGGAKKLRESQKGTPPRPSRSLPAEPGGGPIPTRVGKQPDFSGRGGSGPPPIVPR